MDAEGVIISENENMYPYIERDYTHSTNGLKHWTDNGQIDTVLNGAQTDTLTDTIIHVPNGTIYRNYSVGGRERE